MHAGASSKDAWWSPSGYERAADLTRGLLESGYAVFAIDAQYHGERAVTIDYVPIQIRLEMLWNQLAMTHDFSLLCGYAMGNFYKHAGMREVCAMHSHVIASANGLAEHSPLP